MPEANTTKRYTYIVTNYGLENLVRGTDDWDIKKWKDMIKGWEKEDFKFVFQVMSLTSEDKFKQILDLYPENSDGRLYLQDAEIIRRRRKTFVLLLSDKSIGTLMKIIEP